MPDLIGCNDRRSPSVQTKTANCAIWNIYAVFIYVYQFFSKHEEKFQYMYGGAHMGALFSLLLELSKMVANTRPQTRNHRTRDLLAANRMGLTRTRALHALVRVLARWR